MSSAFYKYITFQSISATMVLFLTFTLRTSFFRIGQSRTSAGEWECIVECMWGKVVLVHLGIGVSFVANDSFVICTKSKAMKLQILGFFGAEVRGF